MLFVKRENGKIVATARRPQSGWPVEKLDDGDGEIVAFENPAAPDPADAVETHITENAALNALYRATADALGVTDEDFMDSIRTFAGETGAPAP
jgi:hypothetical protein